VHDYHKEQRDAFAKIEQIETGKMTTGTNNRDTTAEIPTRFKEWKAKIERIIGEESAKYGLD
jgi:hypothetical protein